LQSPKAKTTKAVSEWPVPKNVKEVRSFLGLCSYYRKFIFHFTNIARPLHKLTEKNQSFVWTEECQMAFENLKQPLFKSNVLYHFAPDKASNVSSIRGSK
jgi:hypothetical protein